MQDFYVSSDGAKLALNLHFPKDWRQTDRRGLVIFFFGGGWTIGSTRQFTPHAAELNRLGMAVATPAYRVWGRDGTTVDTAVRDAAACVAYLYAHAEEYGVDREKIVVGGGSSGGHLALSTLLLEGLLPENAEYRDHIRGLILCNPVLDTVEFGEISEILRKTPCTLRELSPMHNLRPGLPEMILFQGDEDTTVSPQTAQRFVENVRQLGGRAELVRYPGAAHGFFNFRAGMLPAYYNVLGHMVEFLLHLEMFRLQDALAPM